MLIPNFLEFSRISSTLLDTSSILSSTVLVMLSTLSVISSTFVSTLEETSSTVLLTAPVTLSCVVLITLSSSVLYNRYNDLEQITKEDFESKKDLLEQKVLTK